MGKESLIRRWLHRSGTAAVVMTAWAFGCAAPGVAALAEDEPHTKVLIELRLSNDGRLPQFVLAVAENRVQSHWALERLWGNPLASRRGRAAAVDFFRAGGLVSESDADWLVSLATPSEPRWTPENVLRLRAGDDDARAALVLADDGLWHIDEGDCPLVLHLAQPNGERLSIPARTALTVRLVAPSEAVQAAQPLPDRADGSTIEWRFASGATIPQICAGLAPGVLPATPDAPPDTWHERALDVLTQIGFAIPAVALLGLLGIVAVLRRTPTVDVLTDGEDSARRLTYAGIVLAVGFALAQTARVILQPFDFEDYTDYERIRTASGAAAAAIGVIAMLWAARILTVLPWPRRAAAFVPVLAVAAAPLCALPVAGLALETAGEYEEVPLESELFASQALRIGLLALGICAIVVALWLLVHAFARLLLEEAPAPWRGDILGFLKTRRRRLLALALPVAALVGLAAWNTVRFYLEFDLGDGANPFAGENFRWIATQPGEFVVNLLQPLAYLTVTLVVVVVLGMLAGRKEHLRLPPSVRLPDRAAGLGAVLFASAVVLSGSTAGAVLPVRAGTNPQDTAANLSLVRPLVLPLLGFALGVAAILGVVYRRRERVSEWASQPDSGGERLVHRAVTRERAARRRSDLYSKFTGGTLPSDEYFALQRRETMDEPPATDDHPAPNAFSLGPGKSWRENVRIALEVGPWLAVLPLLYVAYVIVDRRVPAVFDTPNPYGPVYLFSDVIGEAMFWLVAAAVLGLIYPYLPGWNGVVKGFVLAGLFVLPHAVIAVVLPGYEQTAVWFFVGAELALFLGALGVWMDYRTLSDRHVYWRHLLDLYRLRSVRGVLAYAVPVALLLFSLVQQIQSGEAGGIVTELLKGLGSIA